MRPVATTAPAGALYRTATARDRLLEAWQVVRSRRGAPGIDRITVDAFERDVYQQLLYLGTELLTRTYAPMPLRRVTIPKPGGGTRALGIPTIRDRIAQNALLLTLMPEAERRFLDCSYGYRLARNAHHAIAVVERLRDAGYQFVVNADIERCFDSLDHEIVFQRAADICGGDEDALELIRRWVAVPTLSELGVKLPSIRGVPQGAPISPLLANLYLHPLDQHMMQRGLKWVRYADDFLCLTKTLAEADAALAIIRRYVDRLRLRLKSEKSGLSSFACGFEFLGFTFMANTKFIAPKRIDEVRLRIAHESSNRAIPPRFRLKRANERIAGFAAYFRTEETVILQQLRDLDGWIVPTLRMNLGAVAAEPGAIRSFLAVPRGSQGDFYGNILGGTDQLIPGELVDLPVTLPDVPTLPRRRMNPAPKQVLSPFPPPVLPKSPIQQAPPNNAVPPRVEEGMEQAPALPIVRQALPPAPDAVQAPSPASDVQASAALFLGEGYAKEDLREFLRGASDIDHPLQAADGTLFVGLHGCALSKASQHMVLRKDGNEVGHFALRDLRQVVVQAIGVVVSTTVLRELARRNIPIHFLDWRGAPFGEFEAPARGSPSILRGQLRAYDAPAGVQIAREMLSAKGKNQLELIRLYERYRRRTNPQVAQKLDDAVTVMQRNVRAFDLVDGPCVDAVRGRLLAIEGRIAAAHFRAIAALVGPEHGFTARTRHGEDFDPINSLLDYAYGLLYTRCHRALVLAGLDPRLGFVHTDGEDGAKLSLLYDFVEEFRAIGADRPVLALVVRGLVVRRLKDGRLALPARRKLLHAFARNLEARCRHRTERRPLADIIDAQARDLAEVLAAKRPKKYRAFRYNH